MATKSTKRATPKRHDASTIARRQRLQQLEDARNRAIQISRLAADAIKHGLSSETLEPTVGSSAELAIAWTVPPDHWPYKGFCDILVNCMDIVGSTGAESRALLKQRRAGEQGKPVSHAKGEAR